MMISISMAFSSSITSASSVIIVIVASTANVQLDESLVGIHVPTSTSERETIANGENLDPQQISDRWRSGSGVQASSPVATDLAPYRRYYTSEEERNIDAICYVR